MREAHRGSLRLADTPASASHLCARGEGELCRSTRGFLIPLSHRGRRTSCCESEVYPGSGRRCLCQRRGAKANLICRTDARVLCGPGELIGHARQITKRRCCRRAAGREQGMARSWREQRQRRPRSRRTDCLPPSSSLDGVCRSERKSGMRQRHASSERRHGGAAGCRLPAEALLGTRSTRAAAAACCGSAAVPAPLPCQHPQQRTVGAQRRRR
jgi:hypothetical protein